MVLGQHLWQAIDWLFSRPRLVVWRNYNTSVYLAKHIMSSFIMAQRPALLLLFGLNLALLAGQQAHAQSLVYEAVNVDSVAAPRGGYPMLETFLKANVQKPLMAQVANVTGKVYVKAIVEPDGHLSDVQIARGIRPDCDREALRVVRLFNAWKPALKEGKPVRQTITYPIAFRPNEPFVYVAGQRIEYFDASQKPISGSELAAYQQATAVDSVSGLPNGPLIVYAVRNGKLRETVRLPLIRTVNKPAETGGPATYLLGHKQADGSWFGVVYTLDEAGNVLNRYDNGTLQNMSYASNGMVLSSGSFDGARSIMQWHKNGILKQIQTFEPSEHKSTNGQYRSMSVWDSTGQQLVMNGNGTARLYSLVSSRNNSTRQATLVETGAYVNGLKDGTWTGVYDDNSYRYTETFDKGKLTGGTARINEQEITYTDNLQPEFKGGAKELYAFLGQNIRYPADAQRARAQGKVFVSFTICTDGSLCDYDVLKGAHPALNEEALRVVKQSNGKWQPGFQRGEPVRVKYNLPVSFQLE